LSTKDRAPKLAAVQTKTNGDGPLPIKLDLPEFRKAMNAQTDLTHPLPTMTAWRYGSGQFPDAVYWLMLGPDMLEALARDARKLPPDTLDQMREIVFTRKPRGKAGAKPKGKGKK
jgi:hypothetical protein